MALDLNKIEDAEVIEELTREEVQEELRQKKAEEQASTDADAVMEKATEASRQAHAQQQEKQNATLPKVIKDMQEYQQKVAWSKKIKEMGATSTAIFVAPATQSNINGLDEFTTKRYKRFWLKNILSFIAQKFKRAEAPEPLVMPMDTQKRKGSAFDKASEDFQFLIKKYQKKDPMGGWSRFMLSYSDKNVNLTSKLQGDNLPQLDKGTKFNAEFKYLAYQIARAKTKAQQEQLMQQAQSKLAGHYTGVQKPQTKEDAKAKTEQPQNENATQPVQDMTTEKPDTSAIMDEILENSKSETPQTPEKSEEEFKAELAENKAKTASQEGVYMPGPDGKTYIDVAKADCDYDDNNKFIGIKPEAREKYGFEPEQKPAEEKIIFTTSRPSDADVSNTGNIVKQQKSRITFTKPTEDNDSSPELEMDLTPKKEKKKPEQAQEQEKTVNPGPEIDPKVYAKNLRQAHAQTRSFARERKRSGPSLEL